MIRVNLGCGSCFHPEWINFDYAPVSSAVRRLDVRERLPIATGSVDVVYHSHVLEHLSSTEGAFLLRECRRVLRSGGVLRVVVPDLEQIARAYLAALESAAAGGDDTLHRWTSMELTDQAARTTSGGEMLPWLRSLTPEQLDRVRTRAGSEIDRILRPPSVKPTWWQRVTRAAVAGKVQHVLLDSAARVLGGRSARTALAEGRFRQSGEVHRVMYDRVSLGRLLTECGFVTVKVAAASESRIPRFREFGLESVGNEVRKPDSLFMEALRP